MLSNFAENAKFGEWASISKDRTRLPEDLDRWENWAEKHAHELGLIYTL